MCILDNASHVIIGFTMPISEARLALFYFDHEKEGSNLILLLHHFVPLWVIATKGFIESFASCQPLRNSLATYSELMFRFGQKQTCNKQ